jgi:hypothetical protein
MSDGYRVLVSGCFVRGFEVVSWGCKTLVTVLEYIYTSLPTTVVSVHMVET